MKAYSSVPYLSGAHVRVKTSGFTKDLDLTPGFQLVSLYSTYYEHANTRNRITFRDFVDIIFYLLVICRKRLSTIWSYWRQHLHSYRGRFAPPKAAIFESNELIIKYEKNSRVLWLYWIGRQTEDSIVTHGYRILQLTKDNPIEIIINNNEGVEGSWENTAKWVKNDWFGKVMAYNVKFFAWIMPKDADAINSVQRAMPLREGIMCFASEREAIDLICSRYPEAYLLGESLSLLAKIKGFSTMASTIAKWLVSMKDSLQAILDFVKKDLP